MRVTAHRREGFAHEVEIEGGHTLLVDEPVAAGGTDSGPAPTRLLGASLATCTAITMEMYAERKGWDIGNVVVDVDIDYERATPSALTVTLHLPAALNEEQRERLREIAAKCPVHKVIASQTPVTVTEQIQTL